MTKFSVARNCKAAELIVRFVGFGPKMICGM